MKKIISAILIISIIVIPIRVSASRNSCTKPSLEEAYNNAFVVFYGEVIEKEEIGKGFKDKLTFKILKIWKGPQGETITVHAQSNTNDPLGDMAQIGDVFLIFGLIQESISPLQIETGFCTGSVKFQYNIKEEDYLPILDTISVTKEEKVQNEDIDNINSIDLCEAQGGIWAGTIQGRGRITGCNLPTKDGSKECNSSDECESVCLEDTTSSQRGKCHQWLKYKGCGIITADGRVLCLD